MIFNLFRKAPPSIEDCGRELAAYRVRNERERIRLRAREMRRSLGLPPLKALGQ